MTTDQPDTPLPGTDAYDAQLVCVSNLKLYQELAESYILDIPQLRHPITRAPKQIPKLLIERLIFTEDNSLVQFAFMERWVAEQQGWEYQVVQRPICVRRS